MSVFTDTELEHLAGQRLGRIATVGPDGQPHVLPPWQPRMIEVRGTAAVVPSGGKAFGGLARDAPSSRRAS